MTEAIVKNIPVSEIRAGDNDRTIFREPEIAAVTCR